jgi:dTDP-4-dehydrorhamnose reductase
MKILIIGKNGQLGRSIHKIVTSKINNNQSSDEFIFVGKGELDLSSKNNIHLYFEINKFDIIVNCAAFTLVDKAEEEKDLANQINHLALRQLAVIANKQQTKLIHISTDYVFDGESNKPYLETDSPNPVNFYGKTKLAGEKVLQELMPANAIIIRTSSLYSEFGNNFVKTMLRLAKEKEELSVVNDQIISPTYASDLAGVILKIIDNKVFQTEEQVTEIYHYSNQGKASWYEFAKEIFKLKGIHQPVKAIITDQYPTPAQRPKNTLMNKDKIAIKFNVKIHNWKSSLITCISLF